MVKERHFKACGQLRTLNTDDYYLSLMIPTIAQPTTVQESFYIPLNNPLDPAGIQYPNKFQTGWVSGGSLAHSDHCCRSYWIWEHGTENTHMPSRRQWLIRRRTWCSWHRFKVDCLDIWAGLDWDFSPDVKLRLQPDQQRGLGSGASAQSSMKWPHQVHSYASLWVCSLHTR